MGGWSHRAAGRVESILDEPAVEPLTARRRTIGPPRANLCARRGFGCRGLDTILRMVDIQSMSDALAGVPLFAGLDSDGLSNLVKGMRVRRFRRGETVFHVGDPGDALFVVMSGSIKITLPADTGDEAILATLRPGDFFGELALLDGAPRSATAVAIEPTETYILARDRFRELIATEPVMREALLATLAAEVRRLTHHVEELHFLDITGRLASRLTRLAAEAGATRLADGTIRLAGPLTQGDLAAMIGCTRQSVNKLLGLVTDDGLIRMERDRILIVDLDGLFRAAHR
jgi:CRP/FNR family cyclic AMP-dependent transcriptional regulator